MVRCANVAWDEPHKARRRKILTSHASVTALQGPEWKSKYICTLALVIPQLYLSVLVPRADWWTCVIVWYVIGCTLTQSIFLAIHELSHNLFFHSPRYNRWFSCFANLPIGIPFAVAFRTYHLRHHASQGRIGEDGDVPTDWECRLLQMHWIVRLVWLSLQIVAYAVRPLLTTRTLPITYDLIFNWTFQLLFNVVWVHLFGWSSLIYLLCCVLGAGSLHPCAGHFVSEHYGWGDGEIQETFSYYGSLNYVTWNVGYHNEHHDFPNVAWSRLPVLSKTLVDYYGPLKTCPSWMGCLVQFVFDSSSYRIVRLDEKKEKQGN